MCRFILFILTASMVMGAPSPEATAKRSKADIEKTLRVIESAANTSSTTQTKTETRKGSKETVALTVTPSELGKARKELARLNAYRYLAGLNYDVQLKDELNLTCKYGAHLCNVIGRIEHTPAKPAKMDDATYKRGYEATSNSNLSWTSGPDGLTGSVDGYMDDSDPSNIARVGHRRWCLNPAMRYTGFGVVQGTSAMWSMDGAYGSSAGAVVCFPAAGFYPLAYLKPDTAWCVSLDPARYQVKSAQVKVYALKSTSQSSRFPADVAGLTEIKLRDIRVDTSGIGIPQCVIFRPEIKMVRGNRYGVIISGIEGLPGDKLAYTVELF